MFLGGVLILALFTDPHEDFLYLENWVSGLIMLPFWLFAAILDATFRDHSIISPSKTFNEFLKGD